ncbi:hypothetical protein [Ferruginibacter sp. HRS2-29]|uniref:hypothetical protein n=1 Tax=Ferruginibacter sp. HRS2-29 TaxID=2487334 RepID=UPI0020CD3CB7|nr:hypothetical protein [Ferruginibacter sp. HRS2-29]MCP9753393.1 hypothetical protein [Ferruginibacter sp. HRS2-29]
MLKKLFLLAVTGLLFSGAFAQSDSARNYKMVVSFHSFASGVPSSKPLTDYIAKFRKANKIKSISADRIGPYGREGEYKLAFTLKELSKKQRTLFISRVKKVVATMNENGSADLKENVTLLKDDMPARATIEAKKF